MDTFFGGDHSAHCTSRDAGPSSGPLASPRAASALSLSGSPLLSRLEHQRGTQEASFPPALGAPPSPHLGPKGFLLLLLWLPETLSRIPFFKNPRHCPVRPPGSPEASPFHLPEPAAPSGRDAFLEFLLRALRARLSSAQHLDLYQTWPPGLAVHRSGAMGLVVTEAHPRLPWAWALHLDTGFRQGLGQVPASNTGPLGRQGGQWPLSAGFVFWPRQSPAK